jgi:eukaryotic-like serine/threonine-protein kinase
MMDREQPPTDHSGNPAQVIAGYRLLRRIGQGGMSTVYLSYEVGSESLVAVKLLGEHLADSSEFVTRFYREARLSRLLSHHNLVRGLAAGYDSVARRHYLILEYIDGPTAHTVLNRLGRFPVEVAVKVGIDIARALEFLHSRHYIHRDIKPDNILLHPDGMAKLADLGLTKRLKDDEQLTSTNQAVGTSFYMSYEQALHADLVDGRSDIFSLGATLYHMMTGVVPFPGATHEEINRGKQHNHYRPVRELNPEVTPELAAILAASLESDPRTRLQTASELAAGLVATGVATHIPAYAQTDGAIVDGLEQERLTRADLKVSRPSDPPGPLSSSHSFSRTSGGVQRYLLPFVRRKG